MVLHERPFVLSADTRPLPEELRHRDLDVVRDRIGVVGDLPAGGDDDTVVGRTQLHALREELRTDPVRAQRRFADLWRRADGYDTDRRLLTAVAGVPGDPPQLLRPPDGGAASTALVDALELADLRPGGRR